MNIREARIITADVSKGANLKVSWERKCKLRKKHSVTKEPVIDDITKEVNAVCRIGIDYDNMKVVKEKRESGELPTENQGIWNGKGVWVDFPFIVRHTNTNKLYLRLYYGSSVSAEKSKKAQFKFNGDNCTFKDIENYVLGSENPYKDKKPSDCFYVKLEDIKTIGWRSKEINRELIKTGAKVTETEPETA